MTRLISDRWQDALVLLAPAALLSWLVHYHGELSTAASFFALHLAVYMVHQIEEHLWPGGFRQFTNARVFHSGEDNFPVDKRGIALVNIGMVWLPIGAAALSPEKLYAVGAAWAGVSFVNSLNHIGASIRLRIYNPGVVTAGLGLLPFSVLFFVHELGSGALSAKEVALYLLAGVALHIPVAALFVVPYWHSRARHA